MKTLLLALTVFFASCVSKEKAVDSVVVVEKQAALSSYSCEKIGNVGASTAADIKRGSNGIAGSTTDRMKFQVAEKGGNVLVKDSLTQGQAFYCVSSDYQQLRSMASEYR